MASCMACFEVMTFVLKTVLMLAEHAVASMMASSRVIKTALRVVKVVSNFLGRLMFVGVTFVNLAGQ